MTLEIAFTILLFLGLLLTCIPTLPGVPIMFATIFAYGIFDHFTKLQPWHLAIFGFLALLSIAIDYFSGLIGAKLGGAHKHSLFFGILGLFIGLLAFPPLGAFIGVFLGVFLAELVQFQDRRKALRAATYSLAAIVLGALTNIIIGIGCLIGFLVVVY